MSSRICGCTRHSMACWQRQAGTQNTAHRHGVPCTHRLEQRRNKQPPCKSRAKAFLLTCPASKNFFCAAVQPFSSLSTVHTCSSAGQHTHPTTYWLTLAGERQYGSSAAQYVRPDRQTHRQTHTHTPSKQQEKHHWRQRQPPHCTLTDGWPCRWSGTTLHSFRLVLKPTLPNSTWDRCQQQTPRPRQQHLSCTHAMLLQTLKLGLKACALGRTRHCCCAFRLPRSNRPPPPPPHALLHLMGVLLSALSLFQRPCGASRFGRCAEGAVTGSTWVVLVHRISVQLRLWRDPAMVSGRYVGPVVREFLHLFLGFGCAHRLQLLAAGHAPHANCTP